MKKLCDFYVAKAEFIGALYCVIPALLNFGIACCVLPFRQVYLLRLALAIIVGAPVAAYLNRFGLSLWLIKHSSPQGPATILDGILIGSALGMAMAIIPLLTHLISSSNMDRTKTIILVTWLSSGLAGAIIGGFVASIGKKYVARPRLSPSLP
jgi:hypothetical protein